MRNWVSYGLAALALIGDSVALPVVKVQPGDASDIIITKDDTLNATTPAPANLTMTSNSTVRWSNDVVATNGKLPLSLVNNFAGAINAYVTGLDPENRLVMLQADGEWYYPSCDASTGGVPQAIDANVAIPLGAQGSTTQITLPGYISAARVWFAAGELQFFTVYSSATNGPSLVEPSTFNPLDPSAAVNWGFVELTNTADGGLYANISYVDFLGLPLGISLLAGDGSIQSAEGVKADAVAAVCKALQAQTQVDGQPWTDLCQVDSNGTPLRVIAPSDYVATNPNAFAEYFTSYVDSVWETYTTATLTINTQAAAGEVACTVQNDLLTCAGDNRGYAKPSALDIFGCNGGPFAIEANDNDVHRAVVPRLCAASNRSTLMASGGNIQPGIAASHYYQAKPTNHYSAFVHEQEIDGKGYAFSYDDVNGDGMVNQSGVVADANPRVLTVTIG